ncbi:cell division control protein 42 homolog [Galendromus occidentalis]|uniref:Cell division control protein 42 homolog n=1 Tax=Galendromus occidentalis TaxID=34638 RepID=A0AAJ6VXB4_9ACAR|nr:cell division control protein 42 homolog [Galendromus occidentalis]
MQPGRNNMRPLKIVVVGDGTVGKTCLLITYTSGSFPDGPYIPTVFDNYAGTHELRGETINVNLWDTAGQEDYERLRPLSYPGTDAFILCFSVSSKTSHDNVIHKWFPEVRHHCRGVPFILVGTKNDLRTSLKHRSTESLNLERSEMEFVDRRTAKRTAKKLGARCYVECSSKELQGVHEVFEQAILSAIEPPPVKKRCTIL